MSAERDSDGEPSAPEKVRELKSDRRKALRAEKDIGDRAAEDADHVEDPRTAVRYLGEDSGISMFQIVTTKLTGFPLGKNNRSIRTEDETARWVRDNDPSLIDLDDEDGFRATDYPSDPLAGQPEVEFDE